MSSEIPSYPSSASSGVQRPVGLVRLPNGARLDVGRLAGLPEGERAATERLLSAWLEQVRRNPLLAFEPFGKQAEFLGVPRVPGEVSLKLAHAGTQGGKTEVGVADDVIQCVDRDCLPGHLLRFKFWEPPFRCRVVTVDLGASIHDVVLPKFRKLCPVDQLATPQGQPTESFDEAFDKTLRVLHFRNGSRVQFMSAEQPREKHQGATLDRVHFDEEPPPPNGQSIYEESRWRCAAKAGQLMFTMTPLVGAGMTWTYDELYQRRDDPDVATVQWGLYDNPYLPKSIVRAEEARITSEKVRRARIYGDFVAFRGRVLEEFDEARHVLDVTSGSGDARERARGLREQVRDMDVLIGYDPGIRRGGVVWCAFDRDNAMLVFDELYPENASVAEISRRMREKNKFWGVEPKYVVIDPAARIRDMSNASESVQSELQRLDWYVVSGQNDRLAGILELKGRLESGALTVSSACRSWLHEIDRWLVASDEESAEGRPKSSKGVSFATLGPDHLMDPTRYAAMERVWIRPAETKRPVAPEVWTPGRAMDFRGRRPAQSGAPMGSMS